MLRRNESMCDQALLGCERDSLYVVGRRVRQAMLVYNAIITDGIDFYRARVWWIYPKRESPSTFDKLPCRQSHHCARRTVERRRALNLCQMWYVCWLAVGAMV